MTLCHSARAPSDRLALLWVQSGGSGERSLMPAGRLTDVVCEGALDIVEVLRPHGA